MTVSSPGLVHFMKKGKEHCDPVGLVLSVCVCVCVCVCVYDLSTIDYLREFMGLH